ncbi:hypothetical protein MRX96_015795 [Rhipicephalus microplus]
MRLPLPVTEGYASGDSQSGAGRRANGKCQLGSATDVRRARRTSGSEVQPLEDLNNAAVPHLRSLYVILEAKNGCILDQRDAHGTLSKCQGPGVTWADEKNDESYGQLDLASLLHAPDWRLATTVRSPEP